MPTYSHLRLMSFRLRAEACSPIRYWKVPFPEVWKEQILRLMAARNARPRAENSVPIDSLNRALRALVPNIVDIDANAGRMGVGGWIIAWQAIPVWAILHIARMWVKVVFGEDPGADEVLARMQEGDLQAGYDNISVEIQASRGGTARVDGLLYTLLPNRLITELARREQWLQEGEAPRELCRVVGGQDAAAEAMSWEPYAVTRKNGDWLYSTVIRLSLQTLPFDAAPVVNLEMGVRRWLRASAAGRFWLGSGSSTVYIRPQRHWIDDAVPECFHVAPIGYARKETEEEKWKLEWKDDLGPLFKALAWPRSPDLARIQTDPAGSISSDPAMGVVFDTGMFPTHAVAPGFMPADRRPMFEQVTDRLADLLEAVGLVPRSEPRLPSVSRSDVTMPPKPMDEEERDAWMETRRKLQDQALERAHLASIVASGLHLEVLHQSPDTLGALWTALTELIGLSPEESGGVFRWGWGSGSISVSTRRLGPLGDALSVTRGCKRLEHRQALATRAATVHAALRSSPARGVIIELQGKAAFGVQGEDPKPALRKGAAQAGRVTQFITPPQRASKDDWSDADPSKNLPHRARATWLDLFRQLGAAASALDFSPIGAPLPKDLQYVGLWFHNYYERADRVQVRVPVLVRMTSEGGGSPWARIATPELPDWLPYNRALTALGGLSSIAFHEYGKDTIAHFIRDAIEGDLLPAGPVVLMAHAQNIRQSWRWMQDGQLEADHLHLPPGRPRPIAEWPGLRVVRVRTEERGETPECYAESNGSVGFRKGLWQRGPRVFASTGNKPVAMKSVTPTQSKFHAYNTRKGPRSAAPGQVAWNPTCLEISPVAVQQGDDPLAYANVAHQLRFAAVHFSDPLVLPLPLHLASLMEEYILPIERRP